MRLGKETSKGSSQGSPAAVVDRLGLVAGLDQVLFTSYIPALCVFIFVRLFSFSFSFFFSCSSHTHPLSIPSSLFSMKPLSQDQLNFFLVAFGNFFFFF